MELRKSLQRRLCMNGMDENSVGGDRDRYGRRL